mgnify:CR=1 FL=1
MKTIIPLKPTAFLLVALIVGCAPVKPSQEEPIPIESIAADKECRTDDVRLPASQTIDACVWSDGPICYAVISQRCASDSNCSNLVLKELQNCQTEYPDRQKKTIGYPLRRRGA